MGSGTKRAADDSTSTTSPRTSKVQKTEKDTDSKNNGKKAVKKSSTTKQPPLSATEFKSKAMPLHVNLTHTPPSILKKVESDVAVTGSELEDTAVVGNDIGFIENITLQPSSFTTGSYGWKGSKRIIVELQGESDDSEGGKEKVQVMLSINATVVGSKPGGKTVKSSNKNEDEAQVPDAEENDE